MNILSIQRDVNMTVNEVSHTENTLRIFLSEQVEETCFFTVSFVNSCSNIHSTRFSPTLPHLLLLMPRYVRSIYVNRISQKQPIRFCLPKVRGQGHSDYMYVPSSSTLYLRNAWNEFHDIWHKHLVGLTSLNEQT